MPISRNYLELLQTRMSTPLRKISSEAERLFLNYPWPGNIRELQNVIEYAANLCDGETLELSDLPEHLISKANLELSEKQTTRSGHLPDSQEKQIQELLATYGHTLEGKKRIAAALGISLRTLYRKLNQMEL